MKYLINGIVFNTEDRSLSHGENKVFLEAKSFQLLTVFIDHRDKVLSRDELVALAWQGQVITDGAVNKAISKLRHHLERLVPNAVFIETKPKFGYRFSAQVKEAPSKKEKQAKPNRSTIALLLSVVVFTVCIALAYNMWHSAIEEESSTGHHVSSQLMRFSAHDGVEIQLSSAANGDVLYVSHTQDGERQLLLKRANTEPVIIPLPLGGVSSVRLSPLSANIALVTQDDGQCRVLTTDINGANANTVFNCDRFSDVKLAWAHDEEALFLQARESNASPFSIYKLKIATQALEQVSLPVGLSEMKGDFLLASHPSLPLLAFARYLGSEQSEIHVLDTVSLVTKSTYSLSHTVNAMAWALENEQLFVANKRDLHLLADDQITRLVKQFSYPIESLTGSMSGQHPSILATQYQPRSTLFRYSVNDQSTQVIHSSAALNRLPRLMPDGSLIFISDALATHDLWQLKNKVSASLPAPFEFGFRRFTSSPDGKFLLFERGGALYEYNLDAQNVTSVFEANHKAYVANYHATANRVIYSSNKSGQWQIWLFDKANQKHHQITQQGGYSGYMHQERLIYSKRNHDGLWALDNGQERKLVEDFQNINWLNWQLINGRVYFYRPDSGIWRFDLDSGAEHLVMPTPDRFLHQYVVSQDEKSIVYAQLQPLQGDIQALVFN
ncbi:hypothetical protein DRW07_10620 [Alteromonas sediminis]|uniref:OmpR/PhoB-type domain-containing protein n=1 Tax=Alteromonas sediminis TaxID=2259342 RepID=A0A3N5Y0U7_9ALTE|nr:winged helix-turn-helix domain-containing protein [Alteromonas sediminis]RPJ66533.1 hypothetical protein DRW07_10620 [Alteromonas sediminis]